MLITIIFLGVSILASVVGSICGIGGGIIMKPVLDATGIMGVSSISFLSGCTVLTMAVVSVYHNLKAKTVTLNLKVATVLALGAAIGGALGKYLFQILKEAVGNENLVGMIQAVVLVVITLGTIIYTVSKSKIQTKQFQQIWVCLLIGFFLGMLSSFLGIGGGPINLVVLAYFFSMPTKEAALCSIYIIMFSQSASLLQTCVTGTIPDVRISMLICMVLGGMTGGMIGSKLNRKLKGKMVNQLFICIMIVIVGINLYNTVKFAMSSTIFL